MGANAWVGTKMAGFNAAGMVVGGAIGYGVGGVDGMLQGAGYGAMAANAALMMWLNMQS